MNCLRFATIVKRRPYQLQVYRRVASSSPQYGDQNATRAARARILPFTLAGITALGIGCYVALLFSSTRQIVVTEHAPHTQNALTEIYDRTASKFDADVNISERLMGITKARKVLGAKCKGHVLEVSCGTARNLSYYRFDGSHQSEEEQSKKGGAGVKSLTLVDISAEMIEQGKKKFLALKEAGVLLGDVKGVPVRFWQGDVKGQIPPPPLNNNNINNQSLGYDTIVQSMGLCSTDEPIQLLQNLATYLNKKNDEARIYLLEHGKSYYPWWNTILDTQAATHASKHGCWWNRDIGGIIQQSGLEIVQERRHNFGTTWIYELRLPKVANMSK